MSPDSVLNETKTEDLRTLSSEDDARQTSCTVEGGKTVNKIEPPVEKKRSRPSFVARGPNAKALVYYGWKEKTTHGLTKKDLEINKFGKVVSKKQSKRGRECFHMVQGWIKAVMKARTDLHASGFVAVNGKSKQGQALYVQARKVLALEQPQRKQSAADRYNSGRERSATVSRKKTADRKQKPKLYQPQKARVMKKSKKGASASAQKRQSPSHSKKDKSNAPKKAETPKAKTTHTQKGASASSQNRKKTRNQQESLLESKSEEYLKPEPHNVLYEEDDGVKSELE